MTGLEEALSLLPWWVVWGPIVVRLPLVFVTSFGIAWVAALIAGWPLRRAHDLPWVERARIAYSARITATYITLSLALLPALILSMYEGRLCPVPNGLLTILVGLTGYAGGSLVAILVERRVRQGSFPWTAGLRAIVLARLLGSPVLFAAIFIPFMPSNFNATAAVLLAAAAGVLLFFGVGGGLFLARLLGLAKPAPSSLRNLVYKVSGAMRVPVAGVYLLCVPQANAYAFPLLKRLAFTPGALEILDDEELAAVCAHELGHLSESRLMVMGRLAFLLALFPLVGAVPLVHSFGHWPVILILMTGLVLANRLSHRLSRHLERRADCLATEQQQDIGLYARALEKIYEANLAPVVEPGKGLTHPHLYDRLVAAGAAPGYPRPRRPSRLRIYLSYGPAFLLLWCLWVGLLVGLVIGSWRFGGLVSLGSAAVNNGSEHTLMALAESNWRQRQFADAVSFQRAACETNSTDAYLPASTAISLTYLDRCEEAEEFAREAERPLAAGGRGTREYIDGAWEAISICRQRRLFPRQHPPVK